MIRKRSDFFVEGVWPISRGKLLILGIVSHVSPLSFIQKTISSKQKPFPRKFSRVYHKYDRSRKNFSHTLTHFSRVFSNFLTTLLTLPPNRNFTFPHPTPPTSPPRPFSPYRVPSLVLALVPCDMSEDLALAPARSASHGRTWEPRGGGEVTTR